MNKKEFMGSLEKQLKYLPKEDRQDALDYYSEYIDEMQFAEGEKVEDRLGNPKEIAKNIIAECTQKQIDKRDEKKSAKNGARIIWMTILMICSLPVTLPIAIALIAVLFSVLVVIASLVLSFGAAGIGLIVTAIFMVIISLVSPGFAQKLVVIGSGLIMLAVGVLLTLLAIGIAELTIKLLVFICKKMISRRNQ
ncbi:MAG: DUF1700 domain-containing protein [Lachnospiraceae bacterium]|nr:DUF1700 domain-containing protein [Lachnospiraceae bacterium]